VSQPRIAVFARSANGDAGPIRIISGHQTNLSRTIHGIAYDPSHDEMVVPNPLAAAAVWFKGGASGEVPPLRVVQGPRTQLMRPETVAIDAKHDELVVGDPAARAVMVYRRDANGDMAPLRVLQGPRTKLHQVVGVAVDPGRDLIVVSTYSRAQGGITGLLVFNRTDNGDVAPRAIIGGPQTGILRLRQIAVDPGAGKIFAAVINNEYLPPYELDVPRKGLSRDIDLPSPWTTAGTQGFIGIWDITDKGDVPPKAIIKGPASGIIHPAGVAVNPKDGEVYAPDSVRNSLSSFFVPEFFRGLNREMSRGN